MQTKQFQTQQQRQEQQQRQRQETRQNQVQRQEQQQIQRQMQKEIQSLTQINITKQVQQQTNDYLYEFGKIFPPPPPPPPEFGYFGAGMSDLPRKRRKQKSKTGLSYIPDFTSRALGIYVKTSKKDLKRLLRQEFTGLETRGMIKI